MAFLSRLQMRNRVLQEFGEAAGYVTTDEIDIWLQDGYVEFASLAECLIDYKPLVVVDRIAVLPPGFVRLIGDPDTGNDEFLSEYEIGTNIIYLRGAEIPQIFVRYVASPSEDPAATFQQMSGISPTGDDKKTSLSERGDIAVIQYALHRCFLIDNREAEAQIARSEFERIAAEERLKTSQLRRAKPLRTSAWTGRQKRLGIWRNTFSNG